MTTPLNKVFITVNGCNRRLLDAKRLKDYFTENSFRVVEHPRMADYILFFASALNDVRIHESWDIIQRLQKYDGELIILGCLQEAVPAEFEKKWSGRHLRIKDMNRIDTFFPHIQTPYKNIPYSHIPFPLQGIYKGIYPKICLKRIVAYLKKPSRITDKLQSYIHRNKRENYDTCFIWVSQGCTNKCSFCAERKTVGDLISRPVEDIAMEYRRHLEKGMRRFELIGDDVGSYGTDAESNFPELINRLSEIDKDYDVHWVIKHLHPKFIIKYRDAILALAHAQKLTEIICCFQSGSNRILELMNRNHSIEDIIETLQIFKEKLPNIRLATNIIVGFPSETEEEFEMTLAVFDKVPFTRVHLLKYFESEGADSSLIPDKIDDAVINKRIKKAKKFFRNKRIYCQSRD